MIKIHKQLWYVINPSREDALAYMTYYEDNAAFTKRKETGLGWARGSNQEGTIIDNTPTKGIYIGSSVSRWSTSNKLFRVKDPRGFTVEVATDNISTLLHLTTVVNGYIQEECVWAREGNNHVLLPVNSQPYLDTLDKMDLVANRLVNVKDLKQGDVVRFLDSNSTKTFIGKAKITWKITPYRQSGGWMDYSKVYSNPYEHTTSSYMNIFAYEGWDNEIRYEYYSNPKIQEVIGKLEISLPENEVLTFIPSGNHRWPYEYEVINIKWKE